MPIRIPISEGVSRFLTEHNLIRPVKKPTELENTSTFEVNEESRDADKELQKLYDEIFEQFDRLAKILGKKQKFFAEHKNLSEESFLEIKQNKRAPSFNDDWQFKPVDALDDDWRECKKSFFEILAEIVELLETHPKLKKEFSPDFTDAVNNFNKQYIFDPIDSLVEQKFLCTAAEQVVETMEEQKENHEN